MHAIIDVAIAYVVQSTNHSQYDLQCTLYSAMLTFFWLDMSAEILLIYLPTYSN